MDRFLSMAVFKRVVDAGSFAAAARHFGISPEMAGNHVKALEAHLGVRLLNRTTRRMHSTEAGAAYHARCAQILTEIEEAEAEAGSQQAAPSGVLRISAPMTFGELHLGTAISDYMAHYPSVSVEVFLSDRHVHLIDEGFDLAVRIGEPADSSLIARRLASARLVLCAAPAYLDRHGRPEKPSDLSRHACLVYADLRSPRTWRFAGASGDRANHGTVQLQQPPPDRFPGRCRTWAYLVAEFRGRHRHPGRSAGTVAHRLALARARNPRPLSTPPIPLCESPNVHRFLS
jgi:DNA-binding transcriptional LysR family regulator